MTSQAAPGMVTPSGEAYATRRSRTLCVPTTSSAPCDQAIFVDQASDVSVFPDVVQVEVGGFGQRFQRRGAVQGAV